MLNLLKINEVFTVNNFIPSDIIDLMNSNQNPSSSNPSRMIQQSRSSKDGFIKIAAKYAHSSVKNVGYVKQSIKNKRNL
jgi:hypothetical protein